jgi:phosphatidylinositol-3,4,5-trisphosphate 3-phosphatase and dual-specificity protein phosphatase PTEN
MSPEVPTDANVYENAPADTSTMSLDSVLALHTARRMKSPRKKKKTTSKRGVSIPSQRRFLLYWSQLVWNIAPSSFWALRSESSSISPADTLTEPTVAIKAPLASIPRVRVREIKVRVQHFGGPKATAVKMINKVLEKSTKGNVSTFL